VRDELRRPIEGHEGQIAEALVRKIDWPASLLDAACDAVIAIDRDLRIVHFNQGAQAMFGYGVGEALGESLDVLLPQWACAAHRDQAHQFFDGDITSRHMHGRREITGRRKDGEEFLAEATITRLEVDHRPFAAAIVRDCSSRRSAAADLDEAMVQLQQANQELERMLYIASHDLQEPLRTITSYLQLLKRSLTTMDDKQSNYIERAVRASTRMKALIQDLLSYSRLHSRPPTMTEVDVTELVAEVISNLEFAARRADAELTAGDMPAVIADRTQLGVVLQNLFENALKFRAPDRRPTIRVDAEEEADAWRFTVRDNGIGIEEKYHERIFSIFQRLHTHEEYEGTGIGLAVCRKAVEQHGGRIWVTSTPGQGTAFAFTIPTTTDPS
jgi:PAS domain S-box-containing protein